MSTKNMEINELKFLIGGGEMGERIRTFDWSKTPLGPIEAWPQSLKTSTGLMLNSQHPMWVGWGRDVTFLYNDAYIQVLSMAKHPWALGKPAELIWKEIWDICGPLADKVFQRGEASFLNDVRLFMNRGDFLEETFYSFSYSPIRDESGNVGGLFCPSAEVTAKLLSTRRLRTLSELAAESLVEKSAHGACASAAAILGKNLDDVPFVLLYLVDWDEGSAVLEQAVGLSRGDRCISPETVELNLYAEEERFWPLSEVAINSKAQVVSLRQREGFPLGAAEQPIAEAIVLPLVSRGQERPFGIMVGGVNPTRKLDAEYRTFYELVAGHIATAIQNASAAEEEKRRADMLAELDRAKTTFFSNVSHELRTPLTLILGPLEDEIRESPAPRERLELVHRNSLRLLKLVNTLLDFSRIEAGRVEAAFEPTDLAAFTSELASVFRSAIERAGLTLIVDCPALPEPIYIDRNMWEKIVFNLLSNALKFTPQGKIEIKLGAAQGPGNRSICLAVRDTGVGIPEAELHRVFERFHRMRNSWARSHEGTGIGLALVQELARLHGGGVSVESAEGHGTTFSVWIPMGMAHLPGERITKSSSTVAPISGAPLFVEEALRWLPDADGNPESVYPKDTSFIPNSVFANTNGPGKDAPGRSKARILLADDNSDMRGYIHRLLADHGFDVTAVGDGQAALEAARVHPPALVLSDVMMPRLDGLGLLKELRNDEVMKSIPIILLSARAGEEARVEGVEAGADDYLTKPFSTRELIARVTTNLKLAQVRKEAQEAILEREERLRLALIEREKSEEKVRATLDSITDGLHVVDAQGRFTYFNATARRIFSAQGLDPDTLMGCDYFKVFPETLTREVGRTMKLSLIEGVATEAENFYPPWQRWYSVRHYPMAEGGVSTFFHDITERKRSEEALRASEFKFRLYFESNIIGNIIGDLDGRIYEANDEYLRIIGYSREELVASNIRWDTITPPEFLPLDHEAIERARQTGFSGPYEKQYLRKDGSRIWVIVGFVIYEGTKTIAFILDISDRKRADDALREANVQLGDKATHLEALVQQRTAKLRETVGELEAFSYSIAHDMRAPLRSLQGFSDILLNDYRDKLDADGQRFLKRIAASAGRMDKLIQDVLNYSRVVRGELPLETVDLDKLIHGIVDTYPAFTPDKADIVLQEPLPTVLGNEAMLTQIFSNLLGNAVKFVSTGVKPHVRVWAERRASHARIFVKDNGIGIESDQHEKIFAIFQQVTKDFEGTGIGLAIVKKAVERMGGKVGLESELDRGSTFWIEIPTG
jgi:PAS domain S-box-containing protein